jgi:hypothetical protein
LAHVDCCGKRLQAVNRCAIKVDSQKFERGELFVPDISALTEFVQLALPIGERTANVAAHLRKCRGISHEKVHRDVSADKTMA